MNLLPAIHQRWAAAAELCALLPANRVFTGRAAAAAPPLAVVWQRADRPGPRANDAARLDTVTLRIEVYDDDYERAAAIVAQVEAAFDRAAFTLDGGDHVLDIRRRAGRQRQRPDGLWQMTLDFECSVFRGGAT